MASIQKTKSGHFVKLSKPIQFRLRGHPEAKMFVKNGFTKYIHELSEAEIKSITSAEAKLAGPLKAAGKHLEVDFELRSAISTSTPHPVIETEDEEVSEEAAMPASVIFLNVPKDSISKLRSRAVSKVDIKASIRGLTLTQSEIHGNHAYLDIFCDYTVTESEETELDLDAETDE